MLVSGANSISPALDAFVDVGLQTPTGGQNSRAKSEEFRENSCAWGHNGGSSARAIHPRLFPPPNTLFLQFVMLMHLGELGSTSGPWICSLLPSPVPPVPKSGPRVSVRCPRPRRACRRRRCRGPGFAGGRSCISSAVHRSVLLALSPSDPSRSSAGRPTGSERSPAGTPLLTSSCWDPATFPAKPGFIMCLCSAAPAAGSGGGEPATTKKTGAQGRLAGGPAPAGARRSRSAAAAATAAREDGNPAAACSSSSTTAAATPPLFEPLAHGGS